MADSFKPSTSKFFMEQSGSPAPRAVDVTGSHVLSTEHNKYTPHAHGVGEDVRAKRQSIPAIVESDFESGEEEILMPTMLGKRRMPKRTGGMVYQLKESKLHTDPYQPLDVVGTSQPFHGTSQPFQGTSQPFHGISQPPEVFSTADDSLAALNVNNTHLTTLRPPANLSRRATTRENKTLDLNKNWTPDKTRSLDDVISLTDEITGSPNQSTGPQGDSDNCSDKRHEDYKQNINSNYEDDGGDEICASAFIGQYLYELWKNQCLCDVRIRVGKSSYLAHKIVLAAFSDVFCPNEPQKLPSLCFDIPNSTPEAVYQILLYLYTSEMELTDGILEEVLNAACFMGIWEVICLIKEILSKPTFENFGMYMGIRERQGMSCGLLDFPDIVREHLLELVDTPHFLNLTIADLETLLKDPDIMVESETDIVHVISKWIEYNPFHRIKCAARLLSLVNFDCMPPETLFDIVEEKKHLFDIDAVQVLLEAFKNHALKPKDPAHTPVQSRGFSDKDKDRKCGSCGSESNLQQMEPMFSFTERRTSDSQVKSFREIRDQFASQRQTEARRMCPCPSLTRTTRDNPDLDNPLPSRLTVKKSTSRGIEKGGMRADEKGLQRADDEYRNPYKGEGRGQHPDEGRAGREYNLGSTHGKFRTDEDSAPSNQRSAEAPRRNLDRRNRNINGIKSSPGYDVVDRSRQPSVEDRSRQIVLDDRSRQSSLEDRGRQGSLDDGGRQVSFDPRCWQNNNESKSTSGRGGWNTASGMVEEEDEEDFLPPPPSKRNVRRRGDIIKSYSSPGETSGSDKLCRKKVTFF
ncbi:uncharacterized protein LOC131948034 [Physella acuta]|uniref:uncharacterized protein LOC131948034 n=1 Tax=Physella acuta TaxID=109671 RepID=UPI0027DC27A8|nr:uncharacterized protein LOC131948034 [Physella acuta]